jgi:site-specific recombinase XerD
MYEALQAFADDKGLVFISAFNLEMTAKFRETWKNKGTAAQKKLESSRTFFKFCADRKWLQENYAKRLGMPIHARGNERHSESDRQVSRQAQPCAPLAPIRS